MKKLFFLLILFVFSTNLNAQNNALHFSGTDYVNFAIPLLPTATGNDTWTVELKFQTTTTNTGTFLSQFISSGTNRFTLQITNAGKINYWKESLGTITESPSSYNDGLWHHLALVKEGSSTNQIHLYIDGVLIISGTDTLPMSTENTEFGKINNTINNVFSDYYSGKLDEVRIWNTARTQTQIQNNINNNLAGTETGLTAYYNFNQGTAYSDNTGIDTLIDNTANANNGTLHSFSLNGTTSNWVGQYTQNNTCATATNLIVSNTLQTVNFNDITFSAITNETLCPDTNPQNYYNLWYDFTLATDSNVYIYGNNQSYNHFVLYDACSGNEISCFNNNKLLQLQAGITYKLRVFRKESQIGYTNKVFTIQSFSQPVNDACATSENITLSETLTTYNFDLRGGTPNTVADCATAGTYYDVWYDFTMPTTPSNLYIQGQQYGGNKYAIYDACNGAVIHCFNVSTTQNNNEIITNLIAGANYKLRVYRLENHTALPSGLIHNKFKIRTYPKTTNTSCATATDVTVTETNTYVHPNFGGGEVSNYQLDCENSSNNYYSAWYTFTMPVSGNLITSSSGFYNYYELFDTCNGTAISCANDDVTFQNLIGGNTYKLRVSRREGNLEFDPSYNNTVRLKAIATANNDTCATSENITVSETENTVNFEIISAQINNEVGCSGTTAENYADIWYDFTMPSFAGGTINTGNVYIDGTAFTNKFAIYDSCGGTEIDCFESAKVVESLTSGTAYKIRVFRTQADAANQNYKSFTITAFPASQNDDCASSESITVGSTDNPLMVNYQFGGASSNPETICGTSDTFVDVWYDFSLTESGSIQILNANYYDGFELYNTCGATVLNCFTAANGTFNNLPAGSYKLRVFRTQDHNQESGTSFQILFQSTLSINNNELANSIEIYPNPASSVINIRSQIAIKNSELFDVLGKKIMTSNQTTMDINAIQSGIYFLKVNTNQGYLIKRIVVK